MADSTGKKKPKIVEPLLEAPPSLDMPSQGIEGLFDEEAMALAASKATGLESFLRLLSSDMGFQDFMRELLLSFMKLVRSEAGSILEINHKEKHFFFRTTAGIISDQLHRFTIPLGKGIVGHVAESRRALSVEAIDENSVHLRAISDSLGFRVKCLVAIPLMIGGRIFGVIELINRVGEEKYSPADMDLLSYLAEQAGKAIEVRLQLAWALRRIESTSKKEAA